MVKSVVVLADTGNKNLPLVNIVTSAQAGAGNATSITPSTNQHKKVQASSSIVKGLKTLCVPNYTAAANNIAFVAAADGLNTSTGSLSFNYTVSSGANRLLVLGLEGDVNGGADDISSVTYNGVAMTLITKITTSLHAADRMQYLYYLLNPASGLNAVSITSTGAHFLAAGAADYTGVSGLDSFTTRQGGGTISTLTTSLTPTADNCWIVQMENGFFGDNAPAVAGAGDTRRTFDAAFGTWALFDSNGPIHPASSYSMTTTRTNACDTIDHILAAFRSA